MKVAATCASCGSVYAAEMWPDGSILPIGRRDGCRCGSDEFDPVESDDTRSEPDGFD